MIAARSSYDTDPKAVVRVARESMIGQQRHGLDTGQRGAVLGDDMRLAKRQLGHLFGIVVVLTVAALVQP